MTTKSLPQIETHWHICNSCLKLVLCKGCFHQETPIAECHHHFKGVVASN